MAAFTVQTALTKEATAYNGFSTYSTVLKGSTTAEFWTTALQGFSGDDFLVGTITSAAGLTHTADKIYLDVSMDGTNWGHAKTGTMILANNLIGTRGFVIDATGIIAPYYRVRIDTVTNYSSTLTINYCIKK